MRELYEEEMKTMGIQRAGWAFFLCLVSVSGGADLSTANRDSLSHFWQAAEQKQRPVTVVSFGDSMADSYQSIAYVLMNRFRNQLGIAGYSLNSYANTTLWYSPDGATSIPPSPFWFGYHFQLIPNSSIGWVNQQNVNGVWSDRVGLFWAAHPNGGPMRLLVSTNGGPWSAVLTLDGYSAEPRGCFTNVTAPLNYHRLKVEGISGTNYIIGPHLLNSQSSGIHVAFMDYPGITLGTVTNVPLSIRVPIFQALKPDLLIWHMKEDGSATTEQRMRECEEWWWSHPECDLLYIGTPWTETDATTPLTIEQNTLVRAHAIQHSRAYVDCMNPATSYDWMLVQGYMRDAVHLNVQGSTYLANLVWDGLGFFALGARRRLEVFRDGNGMIVRYEASNGIQYTLESSTNLVDWQTVTSMRGSGGSEEANVPAGEKAQVYRLRLSP
ncbi:MAG: hypothetical protein AB1705_02660 [Verrucomicrobiota bacterium]